MGTPIWVFLPTYNEAENLEAVVRATAQELQRIEPSNWRVLVVDDASPDGTGALADRLATEIPGVEVLHRAGKDGLGSAYLAGYRHAVAGGAELVIVMDADFSHDPQHLPAMIAAAADSDLVLGSRYVAGGQIADWPPLRRVLSRSGSLYARIILGIKVNDLTTGFRCVRRRVLETVEPATLRSQGYVFNIELTYRALLAGFKVTEVPICFRDREAGQSKMSLPIAFEALLLVPQLRLLRHENARRPTDARSPRRRTRWRLPPWPTRLGKLLGLLGMDPAGNGSVGVPPADPSPRTPVFTGAPTQLSDGPDHAELADGSQAAPGARQVPSSDQP
jgi:dolichol-phosphate mannosyltransferase